MVWYGMVWYGMVWYGMVWYGIVWYGIRHKFTITIYLSHKVIALTKYYDNRNFIQAYFWDKSCSNSILVLSIS